MNQVLKWAEFVSHVEKSNIDKGNGYRMIFLCSGDFPIPALILLTLKHHYFPAHPPTAIEHLWDTALQGPISHRCAAEKIVKMTVNIHEYIHGGVWF